MQDQNLQHPDPQELNSRCDEDLLEGIGRLNTMVSGLQRRLLAFVSEYDRRRLWERDGCRHMGQWLAGHLGVTVSEGLRWTTAANALEELPLISAAFGRGVLSFDKVLQLARFATPDTERALIKWARRASVNAIRRKADLANRPSLEETRTVTEERFLEWSWYDDGTRLGIEGMLPADGGAALVTAIEGIAAKLPRVPETTFEQRCADALVALASAGGGRNEPRATVVLSADLGALGSDRAGCEIEGGPVLHPEVARRISCDCRLQAILRDPKGRAVGIGRRSRNVPGWLLRELLARDGGCSFPGCGTRRFLAAHHLIHWAHGGRTELDNLVLLCSFHHKLVHEGGWKVKLVGGLEAMWLRPNGVRYEPGIRLESDAAASLERLDTS